MPPVPAAEGGTQCEYTKAAGDEPLPGYRLIAPLGRGGFGEVWECQAPGGLLKAIKFVTSESEDGRGEQRLGQELAAFEQIKAIRHPFLLTLERVEQVGNDLVMVMELADRQLQDRFRECRQDGLPGIPRDELLGYFGDAAEALDVISAKFNLQHLDVKPANIFLVAGHAKVGDYGLVAQLEGPGAAHRGLTPRYVAPEVLHGTPSSRSDQYSLALVYYELLTGDFPYPGRSPQQLMLQHVSGLPNLSGLAPADQPVVAKALAKRPDERFPSCLAFVQALLASGGTAHAVSVRRARVDRSAAAMNLPPGGGHFDSTQTGGAPRAPEPTQNVTLPGKPNLTVPGQSRPLISGSPRRSGPQSLIATPPPALDQTPPPLAEEVVESGQVVLERIRSVATVAELMGATPTMQALDARSFAEAVVQAAAGGPVQQLPGDVAFLPGGTWVCRFPSTVPGSVVPLKLAVVRELAGVAVEEPAPGRLLLRRFEGGGGKFFGGKKKYGFELTIVLPGESQSVNEVTLEARLFGAPDARFAREIAEVLPKVLAEARAELCNVPDGRRQPRVPCELPATFFPMHSDGAIDPPLPATCRDASLDGLSLHSGRSLKTKYAYVTFPEIPALAGQAILARLVRTDGPRGARQYGLQYRTDL
jgi:serine/threonine protein kinase